MAKLLEGKPIAERIKEEIKQAIQVLGRKPVLASVQVGENTGAEAYAKSQKKTAEALGIDYQFHKLPQDTTEKALIDFIQRLNSDKSVNGIIIQMPLPAQMNFKKINGFILPEKNIENILPCTPAAVMELLNSCCPDVCGKEVVIVGHSDIVGKPLALMLLDKLATVTVCHIGTSKAGKLEEHVKRAEILIVAVGKAGLIKGSWIKEAAIVIDVGINRVGDKIVGDVEFEEASRRACCITPVPGGVGPLTTTILMRNVVEAAKLQ